MWVDVLYWEVELKAVVVWSLEEDDGDQVFMDTRKATDLKRVV